MTRNVLLLAVFPVLAGLGENSYAAGPEGPRPAVAPNAPRVKNANLLQNRNANPPQGKVVWLDKASRAVWINLGQRQGLKAGQKFSVADPVDDEAIKGHMEVTRVLGPHLSEARILNEQAKTPIRIGDPIP